MPSSLNIHRVKKVTAKPNKHNGSIWLSLKAEDRTGEEVMEVTFFLDGEANQAIEYSREIAEAIAAVNASYFKEEID